MKRFLLIAMLAACGGKSTSTATTTPTTEAKTAKPLPDVPFDDLDQDQREQFMKEKVMPAMAPLFKQHDATKYGEFGCKTCHGEQAKDGHFDMPNPDLPKLNFQDMSKFKKEDIEWMEKDIKPAMAKILKLPEYSKDNPKGFGCLACHTMATGQ